MHKSNLKGPNRSKEIVKTTFENVGRKKQTNQKLFERFYKPQEGESDNEDPNDDLEEIHAALKSGAWGKIKPKVVLEGWPKNPSIR